MAVSADKKRLQITLPLADWLELDRRSIKTGEAKSQMVTRAVHEWIVRQSDKSEKK